MTHGAWSIHFQVVESFSCPHSGFKSRFFLADKQFHNNSSTTTIMSISTNGSSFEMAVRPTADANDVAATRPSMITAEHPPPHTTKPSSPLPEVKIQNPITQLNTYCRRRKISATYHCTASGPRKRDWHCTLTLSPQGKTSTIDKSITFITPPETSFNNTQAAKRFVALEALKQLAVRILKTSAFDLYY